MSTPRICSRELLLLRMRITRLMLLLLLKRSRSIPLAMSNRTTALETRSKHISMFMHFGIRLVRYKCEHRAYSLDCNRDDRPGLHVLRFRVKENLFGTTEQKAKGTSPVQVMAVSCIGRESNPGLAESEEIRSQMATANFTTKPPMLDERTMITVNIYHVKIENQSHTVPNETWCLP
jgi:hypothetical protein